MTWRVSSRRNSRNPSIGRSARSASTTRSDARVLAPDLHTERSHDTQDHPLGVDVCLICFNGGCLDRKRQHALTHVEKTGHTFTLNVKRKLKPSANRVRSAALPTSTAIL